MAVFDDASGSMETNIENVLLYVDDAVRYDALSETLPELGPTFRTVSASTHTPTSFGSLLTGLLPTHNGIHSFKHTVPSDVSSVFDTPEHTVSLAAEGGMNHSLADMFDPDERARIEDVEPPFVHVSRRPGGHAPYDGFDWDTYEYADESALEYLETAAENPERTTREYYDGVDSAFQEFRRVLEVLEERGLREETLVIYTSDHGEVLGEYGFFGHTHMATPEVVYVPTTFIHSSLDPGKRDQLLHHVDILPTADAVLDEGIDIGATDGMAWGGDRSTGYTHLEHVRYGSLPGPAERLLRSVGGFERVIRSLWDENGGHVFVDGSRVPISIVYLGLLLQEPFGRQVFEGGEVRDAFSRFSPGHQSYGTPSFSAETARDEIAAIGQEERTEETVEIDEETVEQLEGMGYI